MCKVRLASPSIPAAYLRPNWRALLRRMRGSSSFAIAEGGRFVPQRISVPVVQFDSYDEGILTRVIRVFVDARRGWRQVCTGNYENHAVPGSHLSMLRTPHVEETARRLRIVLERIDESMGAGD